MRGPDATAQKHPTRIWPIGAPDDVLRPTGRVTPRDRRRGRTPWWRLLAHRLRGRQDPTAGRADEEE